MRKLLVTNLIWCAVFCVSIAPAARRVHFDPGDTVVANRVTAGPMPSRLADETDPNSRVWRSPQDPSTDPSVYWDNGHPSQWPAVDPIYWKVVGNDVVEMTQAEKDAVDQAMIDANDDRNRQEAVDLPESISAEGTAQRTSIETGGSNINGVKNRVIMIFNVLAAAMDSTGGAANMRQAMINQAAQPFPQEMTNAAKAHFPNVNLLSQQEAIQLYQIEAASGRQDRPPASGSGGGGR